MSAATILACSHLPNRNYCTGEQTLMNYSLSAASYLMTNVLTIWSSYLLMTNVMLGSHVWVAIEYKPRRICYLLMEMCVLMHHSREGCVCVTSWHAYRSKRRQQDRGDGKREARTLTLALLNMLPSIIHAKLLLTKRWSACMHARVVFNVQYCCLLSTLLNRS